MVATGIRDSYIWLRVCPECKGEILLSEWKCAGKTNADEWTRGYRLDDNVGWWYVGSEVKPVTYPYAPDDIASVNIYLPELADGTRPNHIQQNRHLKFEVGRPHLKIEYIREWAKVRQGSSPNSPTFQPAQSSGSPAQGFCLMMTSHETDYSQSEESEGGQWA